MGYMRKKLFRQIVTVILIMLMVSQSLVINAEENSSSTSLEYLQSIINMIQDKYKSEVPDEQLINGAIKGMFDTMDPYTTFYTPEEAQSFFNTIGGTFTGIGVEVEKSSGLIFVTKVFDDSPAEESGILKGDIISQINGKNTAGMNVDEAASIITGEEGTSVKLSVIRGNNKGILQFNVKRDAVLVNPVTCEIRGNIGYIRIDIFNSNTEECFSEAIEQLDKNKITRIILDLRGNPGGDVYQAAAVARFFVPKGVIATIDFKSESLSDVEINSTLEKPRYKLALLVNGQSASASEIVSGAVQDTGAGTVIGTKTFGKAKVQNVFPVLTQEAYEKYSKQLGIKIADGFELYQKYGISPLVEEIAGYTKITTGLYYTPNGNMIDGKGIVPDVIIEDPLYQDDIRVTDITELTGTKLLKQGSRGYDVLCTERLLKIMGYDIGTPDVVYDAETEKAVVKFQATVKIKKDGIIGPVTRKIMNRELKKALLKYDPQYAKALEELAG